MGKNSYGVNISRSTSSLGITLMDKKKKTKGLTKKQMKLPKALRDAIMKKKKKQEFNYALSLWWIFKRYEEKQTSKKREKEKKEKKINQGWVFSTPLIIMGITTSTLIQELIPRSSGKRRRRKQQKSFKAKQKVLRVKNPSH